VPESGLGNEANFSVPPEAQKLESFAASGGKALLLALPVDPVIGWR